MRTREELSLTDSVTENHDSLLPETQRNEQTNKRFEWLFLPNCSMRTDSFKQIMKSTTNKQTHCRYPRENINPGQNVAPVLLDYGLGANSRKGVT